jgi:hypothetical protein
MAEENDAWAVIQLQEKTIEPDKTIFEDVVTRNLQLGNIPSKDMKFYFHMIDRGVEYKEYPKAEGGWLYKSFGNRLFKKLDAMFVASNSDQGYLRAIMNTQTKIQRVKDETPAKGFFKGMRTER